MLMYFKGEQGVDVMAEKQNALRHYKAARAAIGTCNVFIAGCVSGLIKTKPTAGSSGVLGVDPSSSTDKSDTAGNSDAVERQDLSDELDETIKALTIDIKVLNNNDKVINFLLFENGLHHLGVHASGF